MSVTCFGEMLMRLSPPGHERFLQSPHFRTWFGGSEANVAVGLAHLGTPSRYVTRLPANPIGDAAVAALRLEGVDASAVLRGGPRMGLYFVESGADLRPMRVVYDRAGSSFTEVDAGSVEWDGVLAGSSWLHLSGITPAVGEGPARAALAAATAARKAGVKVSLDLNYRPTLWAGRDPRPHVEPLARVTDLLVGNPGAFAAMLGVVTTEGASDDVVRDATRAVQERMGCSRVVVTRRDSRSASRHGWNAVLLDAASGFHVSRHHDVQVVDRVGGGDSFVAGLLHALLQGREAGAALEFATAASALKLTVPGDFNRVSADEVDRLLQTLA